MQGPAGIARITCGRRRSAVTLLPIGGVDMKVVKRVLLGTVSVAAAIVGRPGRRSSGQGQGGRIREGLQPVWRGLLLHSRHRHLLEDRRLRPHRVESQRGRLVRADRERSVRATTPARPTRWSTAPAVSSSSTFARRPNTARCVRISARPGSGRPTPTPSVVRRPPFILTAPSSSSPDSPSARRSPSSMSPTSRT